MAIEPDPAASHSLILQIYNDYSVLMARDGDGARDGLGGQLLWAGELDAAGSALTAAGSIAGAATLAATSDPNAQRSAVRDGVVDFLVNSLDEALRILKNEVRKRETVAVCVAVSLEEVEREMAERGVRPDVFRDEVLRDAEQLVQLERNEPAPSDPTSGRAMVSWRVDRTPAVWLPKIDAIALECLAPDELVARRWLQRSNRYLGRIGRQEHLVQSNREFASRFVGRVQHVTEGGEIKTGGRIEVASSAGTDACTFIAPDANEAARQT